jgi:hypothetical protein
MKRTVLARLNSPEIRIPTAIRTGQDYTNAEYYSDITVPICGRFGGRTRGMRTTKL